MLKHNARIDGIREQRESVRLALQKALGPTFDVVLESDHFHVEFQPKTGLNL